MRRFRLPLRLVCLVAIALVLASPSRAEGVAGHWEGAIELPGQKLGITVDLSVADGALSGTMGVPAQQLASVPLVNCALSVDAVKFTMQGIPGDPTFDGKLSADGKTIAGTFTQGGQSFPFSLTAGAAAAEKTTGALDGFDAVVTKTIADWDTPGVAIAIVRDGKVVWANGFGKRDVARDLPVTTKTLFAIGSTTKAFTTFVMGTLVDEGKLAWDVPVRTYLPKFALEDPVASEHITPRDLVTHRSGLPRHDLLWYNNTTMSRDEMVAHLAHLPPSAQLREKFQYNNLMFLTAGQLIAKITGGPWEDAVRARIFEPLGMTASNFSVVDSQKSDDFAKPYDRRDEKTVEIPFRDITGISAAGAINSNVEDLAKWAIVQLGQVKVAGKDVISAATLAELHRPQMVTGDPQLRPEISSASYALGWFVDSYRGHIRVHHGGAIDGFGAFVCLLPNDGLAIVSLENKSYNGVLNVLTETAIDRILGLSPIDWSADGLSKIKAGEAAAKDAKAKKETVRRTGTSPAHALAEYAGVYENEGYGPATVRIDGTALTFSYNGIEAPLSHWHYEVFAAGKNPKDPVLEDQKILFRTDFKGNVSAFEAAFEPATDPIVFKKRPDARLSDPAYLGRFLGRYDLASQQLTIGLKGNALAATLPGQPTYDLVPDLGDEFNIKGLTGYSARFVVDAKGSVTSVQLIQPEGVFTAKKIE